MKLPIPMSWLNISSHCVWSDWSLFIIKQKMLFTLSQYKSWSWVPSSNVFANNTNWWENRKAISGGTKCRTGRMCLKLGAILSKPWLDLFNLCVGSNVRKYKLHPLGGTKWPLFLFTKLSVAICDCDSLHCFSNSGNCVFQRIAYYTM